MLLPILIKSFLFCAFIIGIWDYTYIWLDQMWFLLYSPQKRHYHKIWSWWICASQQNINSVRSLVHLQVRGLQDFLMWTTVTLLSFDSVVHWIDIRESLFTFYSSFHSFIYSFLHSSISFNHSIVRSSLHSFPCSIYSFAPSSEFIHRYLLTGFLTFSK